MKKIAIFASGSGSNAEKIMEYFKNHQSIKVSIVLTNKANAGVLERAKKFDIPTHIFDRSTFRDTEEIVTLLQEQKIDLIALAGFLWLIPKHMVEAFPNKILNIHPALLPNYGGKGMHGMHVHLAVVQNQEQESGMTIHYVNEKYDDGQIIFQDSCNLLQSDTPEDVAAKVLKLEHLHFARVIEEEIQKL